MRDAISAAILLAFYLCLGEEQGVREVPIRVSRYQEA